MRAPRAVVRTAEQRAGYIRTGHHGGGQGAVARRGGPDRGRVRAAHLPRRRPAAARAYRGAEQGAARGRGGHTGGARSIPGRCTGSGWVSPRTRAWSLSSSCRRLGTRWSSVRTGTGPRSAGSRRRPCRRFRPAGRRSPRRFSGWPMSTPPPMAAHRRGGRCGRCGSGRRWRPARASTRCSGPRREDLAVWAEQSRQQEVQILADVHQAVGEFAAEHDGPAELDTEGATWRSGSLWRRCSGRTRPGRPASWRGSCAGRCMSWRPRRTRRPCSPPCCARP